MRRRVKALGAGALAIGLSTGAVGSAPDPMPTGSRAEAVRQWRERRIGLFVHWGVASGRALPQSHSHARHSVLNPSGSVPAETYDQYYREFDPTAYDPDAWLKLAHDAGMRYAVFVAKHHDGFSMYGSEANPYNVLATPYGRDVAAMFADACRRQGLALGWQLSPKDWRNPDFASERHDRYNAWYEAIVRELATRYGPLAVMWFDGIEPVGADQWKDTPARVAAMLHELQPGIMLSNHGGGPEDFVSFETLVGPFDRRQPWEMTEPINPSGWVFNKPMPTRPLRELLRNLVYSVSRDGNYLLDVGPMPDGRLYPPDAERLGEIAQWMKANAEGIHATRGGPYRDGDWGGATCRNRFVYLFVSDRVGTDLVLPPLAARVRSARRLDGGPLDFHADAKGVALRMPDRAAESRPVFLGIRLEVDRPAFDLPVVDGQPNLAAPARIAASSVRDGDAARWGVRLLFDDDGGTAWDPDGEGLSSFLEIDLGAVRTVGSVSFSQRTQRLGWHPWFTYELKARTRPDEPWRSVYRGRSCLGGLPVLEIEPTRARQLRLEIVKPNPQAPVQLAELRVFAPLPGVPARR
jgi:alpha-L-fucosidase